MANLLGAPRVEAHALAATVSHRVILTTHWDDGGLGTAEAADSSCLRG
jgi:hypothetical protein